MIRVALNEVKDELSRYLRMAETEDVIITRHGVPAGLLIGFEDPEDWWEELLLRNPRFQERIEQSRQSLREGQGITLEELRKKHNIPSNVAAVQESTTPRVDPAAKKVIKRKSRKSQK
ncbi:MAG: type II toxin-antitoxin system Phd/YefM family antitoxin [Caldilineaceae bacterium]